MCYNTNMKDNELRIERRRLVSNGDETVDISMLSGNNTLVSLAMTAFDGGGGGNNPLISRLYTKSNLCVEKLRSKSLRVSLNRHSERSEESVYSRHENDAYCAAQKGNKIGICGGFRKM